MRVLARSLSATLLSIALLAGCAGGERHRAIIAPEYAGDGNAKVDMLAVTTRTKSSNAEIIYTGERADQPSLYNMVVSIPPAADRKVGEVQWPKGRKANPKTDFITVKASPMMPNDVEKWFLNVAGKRRKVLIFIHGFNSTFDEAAYRLAQISHDSGSDAAPILFTWPSRGSAVDYVYDKESATYSRDTLEFLLTRAATHPNVSDVTVMAHSMGNWVLMEALRQMAIRNGRVYPKIKNVVMASPDLDIDVFRSQYVQLAAAPPKITVFLSRDDRALGLSRRLGGNVDRLGAIDPSVEPYKSKLDLTNITVIDLTKVKSGDRLHHGKFAESPEIVRLIGTRLIEGQQIEGRDLSVGEQISGATSDTAGALGRAVGVIIATPFSLGRQ